MLVIPSRAYGLADAAEVARMTGLEFLQAMIDGRLPGPPIAETLSFEILEVGEGFALFAGETGSHLLNPMGAVHGGWALTLIDTVTGCAAHTLLPAGSAYTTIETKANFTRPITKDTGRVRGEGRVVSRGRRIIIRRGPDSRRQGSHPGAWRIDADGAQRRGGGGSAARG